jgi:hypothetical protein
MKLTFSTVSALAAAFLSSLPVFAAEKMTVKVDETMLLNVSGEPASVIIGNPSIVDATSQGTKILLHGRSFGSTNLTILDVNGKQLVAFEVSVQMNGSDNVALFKDGYRYSYVCAPLCQVGMAVGDDTNYVSSIMTLNGQKMQLATGSASAQSPSPKIPVQ